MSAHRQPVKLEVLYHRLVYSANINRRSINQWFLPRRVYTLMEASSGPTIEIFPRCSEHRSSIDREGYDPGVL